MDRLKEFLQWNIEHLHNVSFKNIVGYLIELVADDLYRQKGKLWKK